jgi:hypothetical protein
LQSHVLQYLRQQEIDKKAYDRCIDASHQSLIYAKSAYLDQMATNWDLLVLDNYAAVMPLTWRKKMGIRYLYQPAFTQQLGIFSDTIIGADIVDLFLNETRKHFSFGEIFINNLSENILPAKTCSNYTISLDAPYKKIETDFKADLKRNLSRAKKKGLQYIAANDVSLAIDLYQAHYGARTPQVSKKDFQQFKKLCGIAQQQNQLLIRQVLQGENRQLLAIGVFLKDDRRIYNLANTTVPEGRKCGANHLLLSELISEFAEKPFVLDLEGSNIPGIASFYQNFGAVDEPYYFWKFNDLPAAIRWFKK